MSDLAGPLAQRLDVVKVGPGSCAALEHAHASPRRRPPGCAGSPAHPGQPAGSVPRPAPARSGPGPPGERGRQVKHGLASRAGRAATQMHEAARICGHEGVGVRDACQLLVGHRHGDLRLADRERPAEAAAQIRPWQCNELRAGAVPASAGARRRSRARAACGTSRGRQASTLHCGRGASAQPGRGRRRAPRSRRGSRQADPADSGRPWSRRSRMGRRRDGPGRRLGRTCGRRGGPRRDGRR